MNYLEKSKRSFQENFRPIAWFGRCIFLSWYCQVATCKFCFRSTTKHRINNAKSARRSVASILTDAILGKNLNWRIEFITGGYGIFEFKKIVEITKLVSKIYNQKIWVNLGKLTKKELKQLKPYVEGICASIETVEPKLHNKICPDKPIEPYENMLKIATELGFKKSITIVIGLGEKKQDIKLLHKFIKKHNLDRITFYALKPVKGTPYTQSPDPEYYSWWVAQTRIEFPKLEIIAGLTPKNPDYTKLILESGANAITKFPVVRKFNSKETRLIESQVKQAGREFISEINKLPDIDWDNEVDKLNLDKQLTKEIKIKLNDYIKKMKN